MTTEVIVSLIVIAFDIAVIILAVFLLNRLSKSIINFIFALMIPS